MAWQNLFDIHPGEGLRTLLMFFNIFFIIAALLVVKPVRNSLFLTHFGIEQLPAAYILVAAVSALFTAIYTRISPGQKINRLAIYTHIGSVVSLLIFWVLLFLNLHGGWFYYAFYVWVAIFGLITTSQFWLLANYVFNAREAKRLFGIIGAGAISGGIFGGYLTKLFAPRIGTHNLLLICIAFLTLCIALTSLVWKISAPHRHSSRIRRPARARRQQPSSNPLKTIFASRYLLFLAAIVGVSVLVAGFVDYLYNAIASESITDADQLTAFFGFWLSNLSIISLLIQLFVTTRVLKAFGVGASLLFLPIGLVLGSAAIFFLPALWSAILLKVSDGSFKQSINKAGMELLFIPIPAAVKNQVKSFIDIFIDHFATGIAGVLLLVLTLGLALPIKHLSLAVTLLIVIWIWLIGKVKREYINSFRAALAAHTIDIETQTINLEDASVIESLVKVLAGNNERKILYALDLIENVNNDRFIPHLRRLIHHPAAEIKIKILELADAYDEIDFVQECSELVEHPDPDVRIAAIRHLCGHSLDRVHTLKRFLADADIRIGSAALTCAAREVMANPRLHGKIDIRQLLRQRIADLKGRDSFSEEDEVMKISLAEIISTIQLPELYFYLEELLADASPRVIEAAIISAGKTRDRRFVALLLGHSKTRSVRHLARQALAEYGEDITGLLAERLLDAGEEMAIRSGAVKTLALIGSQHSVDSLINNLDGTDLFMRYEMIKALNKLKREFSELNFRADAIEERIFAETQAYLNLQALWRRHADQYPAPTAARDRDRSVQKARALLARALQERLGQNLERIFRLLGLRYKLRDMYNAYQGIISQKPDFRANAIEFLDNVLDSKLKKIIIPIVETQAPDRRLRAASPWPGEATATTADCLAAVLDGNDTWLKACALYLIAESQRSECLARVRQFASAGDPVLRETAAFALNRLQG